MAAFSSALKAAILVLFLSMALIGVKAQVDPTSFQVMGSGEALEWPPAMSAYSELVDDADEEEEDNIGGSTFERRSLYWKSTRRPHYYISYGALSANRIPCPPRSGRSYYTHSCFRARTPVNPYTRGCSCITHCRR